MQSHLYYSGGVSNQKRVPQIPLRYRTSRCTDQMRTHQKQLHHDGFKGQKSGLRLLGQDGQIQNASDRRLEVLPNISRIRRLSQTGRNIGRNTSQRNRYTTRQP